MFGTRTSDYWKTQPGKFDVLNLRQVFESSTANGIPDLKPTDVVPTDLAAWNIPRQRAHAAANNGALHFFLDDYRFETVWFSPERLLDRVQEVGTALTPDFSIWVDMPPAAKVWNIYRNRWCGAYWQSQGIEVIPTVHWAGPETYGYCFEGIPMNSIVATSSMGAHKYKSDQILFRDGMQELVSRVQPRLILAYGKLRYCDGLDLPEVKGYPSFWDRRRKQLWEPAEADEDQVLVGSESLKAP